MYIYKSRTYLKVYIYVYIGNKYHRIRWNVRFCHLYLSNGKIWRGAKISRDELHNAEVNVKKIFKLKIYFLEQDGKQITMLKITIFDTMKKLLTLYLIMCMREERDLD